MTTVNPAPLRAKTLHWAMSAAMTAAPRELSEADANAFYRQVRRAIDHIHPESDLGEIEWVLYQFVRLDFGPADDPLLNFIRECKAKNEILRSLKLNAKVSTRVLRAVLVCQKERVARHRRKMEGKAK